MDDDDLDYFPRRMTAEEKQADTNTKNFNLRRFVALGLLFSKARNGDMCVFRSTGKPTVDFFTRKNRWKVRGQKKTTYGSADEFAAWLGNFWNEPATRVARNAVYGAHPDRSTDLYGVTSKEQAERIAAHNLKAMFDKLDDGGVHCTGHVDYDPPLRHVVITGAPVSTIIPNDMHIFDASGTDLGRANVLIKGFIPQPGETLATTLQKCLEPGQSLRIVYDRGE